MSDQDLALGKTTPNEMEKGRYAITASGATAQVIDLKGRYNYVSLKGDADFWVRGYDAKDVSPPSYDFSKSSTSEIGTKQSKEFDFASGTAWDFIQEKEFTHLYVAGDTATLSLEVVIGGGAE